jgi:hypothetical protein
MYFSIPKFRQSSEYETVILAAPSTYLGNSRTARGVILAVFLNISAGLANSSVSPFLLRWTKESLHCAFSGEITVAGLASPESNPSFLAQ